MRANPSEIPKLKQYCFENRKYAAKDSRVNVAEFTMYMGGDRITSKECLEWVDVLGNPAPQCLPLGGQSVWGTLGPLDSRDKVIISSKIDAAAFFHGLSYGANDAIASIVATLGAFEAVNDINYSIIFSELFNHVSFVLNKKLGRNSKTSSLARQPVFLFANGEDYGRIGSTRFANDIFNFQCRDLVQPDRSYSGLPVCLDPIMPNTLVSNIGLSSIYSLLSVDQVGRAGDALFVHSVSDGSANAAVDSLTWAASIDNIYIKQANAISVLPSSSIDAFITKNTNLAYSSAVLAGYNSNEQSSFDLSRHSRFDTNVTKNHVFIKNVVR